MSHWRAEWPYSEGQAPQIVFEVSASQQHSAELPAGDTVALFGFVEHPAEIRYHSLSLWPHLGQHLTHAHIISICAQNKRQDGVSRGKDSGPNQCTLQAAECLLTFL
ncbi:hypothetical protein AAFF_G00351350 [Aldrovandia affinis]|uniref:Uncharacterized protein n=1 Tax=Aldrovandia affinis TaxID=143900 RepID=A0AAD7WNM8_9TELE|nr:hypothetical protein AAFF_G00351350 [Aldrovandia affinis]